MGLLTFSETVENVIRLNSWNSWRFFAGHEFHENNHCDLDAIGSKYKFSGSHGRAIHTHLTVTPKNLDSHF